MTVGYNPPALPQLVGDAMTIRFRVQSLLTLEESPPCDVLIFRSFQADTMP